MMEKQTQQRNQAMQEAYNEFEFEFELRFPPPSMETNKKRWALRILLGASVIASARHNIPFFVGDVSGGQEQFVLSIIYALAVVLMVEIGLVILGEFIVDDFGELILKIRPALSVVAIILLLIVAVLSNLADGFGNKGLYISDEFKTAINGIANITAPLMALIIGIIFASLQAKVEERQRYYQAKKNKAWNKYKDEMSITVSKPQIPVLPTMMENSEKSKMIPNSNSNWNRNGKSGSGFNRSSTAMEQAIQHYRDNPSDLERSPLEVAKEIGVSKSTMYSARKTFQEGEIGE